MKKLNLRKWIGPALGFGIGIGGGFALGIALGEYIDAIADRVVMPLWFVVMLLGTVVLLFAQIAVHEVGHLLGGLASGYAFSSYRIGSLMLIRVDGRLTLRRLSIAGTGGQCLMAPPPMVDGRIPYRLYHLGGALANLAATAIFALLWLFFRANVYLAPLCVVGAALGLIFALTNGIPIHTAQLDNDGYNALSLGRDPAAMRAIWAQMQINASLGEGNRLHDMPPEWFDTSGMPMHNALCAPIAVFACNRLLDAGDYAGADAAMASLLAADTATVGIHRSLLLCDRITVAYLRGDTDRAQQMHTRELAKFMRSMAAFPSVIRTEYVLALCERNEARAEKCLARFEKTARQYPYPADIACERELIVAAKAVAHG